MSKDQIGFILNFLILTLILNFAMGYFFSSDTNDVEDLSGRAPTELTKKTTLNQQYTTFSTEKQKLYFNSSTGDLAKIELLDYQNSNNENIQTLFSEENADGYQLFSTGIIIKKPDGTHEDLVFDQTKMNLTDNGFEIIRKSSADNIEFIHTYREDEAYTLVLDQKLNNLSNEPISIYTYNQLENTHKAMQPGTIPGMYMFQGASFHTDTTSYTKIPFSKFKKSKFNELSNSGWFSFSQRYFVSAIKPSYKGNFYSKYLPSSEESIAGHLSEEETLMPLSSTIKTLKFFSGPEEAGLLKNFDTKLDMVVDYGMLWPIAKVFFYLLTIIHSFVHNWGLSIIVTTLVIKLAFSYHSQKSFVAMDKMRKLQPELEKIKEQHKDNQQQLYTAMTGLYSTHKVNPMSGLLLNFIQIPFFIAFYSVLMESIELRGADFLWIADLSMKDPLYILPITMGLTMFIQQFLSPPPQDETMALVMRLMPVIFTFFFLQFPSGLVLYWLSNTIFTIIHMGLTRRASAGNSSA